MSNQANRRILSDLKAIKKEYEKGIYVEANPNNILSCRAIILGPKGTVWDGGCFKLSIEFTKEYPTSPPIVKFITPMFHPNSK